MMKIIDWCLVAVFINFNLFLVISINLSTQDDLIKIASIASMVLTIIGFIVKRPYKLSFFIGGLLCYIPIISSLLIPIMWNKELVLEAMSTEYPWLIDLLIIGPILSVIYLLIKTLNSLKNLA